MPTLLKDLTAEELHERLSHLGVTLRQARQIHATVVRRSQYPTSSEHGIAARLLDEVRQCTTIPNLMLLEKHISPTDGFAKYLLYNHPGSG